MTMRYLFFVFVILCSSNMTSLCMATPIVVDYSVTPKTTLTTSASSTQSHSDDSLSQQETNKLIIQQKNGTAPPVSISTNTKEFQPNDDFNLDDGLLSNKDSQQEKDTLIHLGFNFSGFHQPISLAENPTHQQSNQNHASLNLKNILKDSVKDSEVLMELAEGTIEVYRSFSDSSAVGGFQTTSPTASFVNKSYGASRDFLDTPPLITAQQQAPTARRSWGEETFLDKLIQFCLSWKGLLTLCGFLIFNSILFKLV
jgi:hypothetical protein